MGRRGRAPVAFAALVALSGLAAGSGCGDDGERFGDQRIVDALHLEESDDAYAIDGDPFCEVEKRLLNNADEVDEADGDGGESLVVASRTGNVGITGVAPFAPSCVDIARKRLDKLDPPPKDD